MEKRFWIIIGIIAVLFLGILYLGGKDDKGSGKNTTATTSNHVKGKLDSKVTLLEYGDFQCPVCGSYYATVSQVVTKYEDKIKFQFRNLPLTQIHQHAFAAARAAEAASEQGKFWQMYDLLFANQTSWSGSTSPTISFKQYASQVGIDTGKYETAFASDKVNDTINADVAAFKKTKQSMGTPTFFLNGKKLELTDLIDSSGQPSLEKFSKYIDAELKAKGE
jgi:protein-disulfide isomerase